MKKYKVYIGFLLLAGLSSCDDSYRGVEDELVSGKEPLPVIVSVGDPSGNVVKSAQTKGFGPVDKVSDLLGKDVYVYAFNKNDGTSYKVTRKTSELSCLVDASTDTPSSTGGKKAMLNASEAYLDWGSSSKTILWPNLQNSTVAYDFFAYYLGGITPSPSSIVREDDRIFLNLEIDGNNDLMTSKSYVTASQQAGMSDKDKLSVDAYSFSYYTAARNINPSFVFNHNLVRLDFEAIPGVTMDLHKKVFIQNIVVASQTNARLTVAAKDPAQMGVTFIGSHKSLPMALKDGSPFPQDNYYIITRMSDSERAETLTFDGSLFLAPSSTYSVTVGLKEMEQNMEGVHREANFNFSISMGEDGFVCGNRYKVKMTVYGSDNVSVSVSAVEWEDGGGLIVDKGDEPPV